MSPREQHTLTSPPRPQYPAPWLEEMDAAPQSPNKERKKRQKEAKGQTAQQPRDLLWKRETIPVHELLEIPVLPSLLEMHAEEVTMNPYPHFTHPLPLALWNLDVGV